MGAAFIGELIRILDAAHADARGRRYLEGCWSCDRCQRDPRNRRVDRLRAVRAMQRRRSWCRTQGTQLVQSQDEAKPLSATRSEEHTSELQSLMRISYAVFCLKKKKNTHKASDEQMKK